MLVRVRFRKKCQGSRSRSGQGSESGFRGQGQGLLFPVFFPSAFFSLFSLSLLSLLFFPSVLRLLPQTLTLAGPGTVQIVLLFFPQAWFWCWSLQPVSSLLLTCSFSQIEHGAEDRCPTWTGRVFSISRTCVLCGQDLCLQLWSEGPSRTIDRRVFLVFLA